MLNTLLLIIGVIALLFLYALESTLNRRAYDESKKVKGPVPAGILYEFANFFIKGDRRLMSLVPVGVLLIILIYLIISYFK